MATSPYYSKYGLKTADYQSIFDWLVGQLDQQISTQPSSLIGQLLQSEALQITQLVGAIQWAVDNSYWHTAEGVQLDFVASLIGIVRQTNTKTRTICQITASFNQPLAVGFLVRDQYTKQLHETIKAYVLDGKTNLQATIKVQDLVATDARFSVNISNSQVVVYRAGLDFQAYVDEILRELNLVIFAEQLPSGDIKIGSGNAFSLAIIYGASWVNLTQDIEFFAVETGAIPAYTNSLTEFVSVIANAQITNKTDGIMGRESESDEEFRVRIKASRTGVGGSSIAAITSALLSTAGVSSAFLNENNTDQVVNNLPPHSFQAVVVGGSDTDIANTIWTTKPAGIATYGDITVNVNGIDIKFSRGIAVAIYIKVDYKIGTNDDQNLLLDSDITAQILAYGQTVKEIVSPMEMNALCAKSIAPLGFIRCTASLTSGGVFVDTELVLSAGQSAVFSASNIEIVKI